MDFFENGFLSSFPETLYFASAFALNNVVLFVVVAIVALELSRRITQHGAPIAALIIITMAVYAIGATTVFTW